jgi:hypothetical protein
MATLEMVDKLKQRAGVTYDEAKAALDACGDDLLEAIIYLERQGKIPPPVGGGYYSTQHANLTVHPGGNGSYAGAPPRGDSFGDMMRRFGAWIKKVIHKGNTNHFEVWHQNALSVTVPVTVLALLLVFCFWITLPLMVVGLFFGCTYRFRGPELEDCTVNSVMDSAAKAADGIKSEVKNASKEYKDHH